MENLSETNGIPAPETEKVQSATERVQDAIRRAENGDLPAAAAIRDGLMGDVAYQTVDPDLRGRLRELLTKSVPHVLPLVQNEIVPAGNGEEKNASSDIDGDADRKAKEKKEKIPDPVLSYGEKLYRMFVADLCPKQGESFRGGGGFVTALRRMQERLDAVPGIREAFLKIRKNSKLRKVRRAFKPVIKRLNQIDKKDTTEEEKNEILPVHEKFEHVLFELLERNRLMKRKFWNKKRKKGGIPSQKELPDLMEPSDEELLVIEKELDGNHRK